MRLARRLIKREKGNPGLRAQEYPQPEVRYLTLPGIDYLDVRQLADLCHECDCCLTSIGFQSGGEHNPQVARAQVREKSLIDARLITEESHTFPRRFEEVVHPANAAYLDLRNQAPFHIVNIDACGSIAAPTANHPNRLIDALFRVVELQVDTNSSRWLLFVTTDVRPESIDRQTLNRLYAVIFSNADTNDVFRDRAALLLAPGQTDIRAAVRIAAEQTGQAFLRLFALGVAKWLLDLVKEKGWDVYTHHPYCYSTGPQHDETPSMVCLAFEFLPPPPGLEDRRGVTHAKPKRDQPRENTAVRAALEVGNMIDADDEVRSDPNLRALLINDLHRLLEEAGYEREALEKLKSLQS